MLTVLIATYNGAATLPKVLQAYCALQTPPGGWRMIVIDNGSTDGTGALLASFAARLPLTCLREPRGGKNAALNTGVAAALDDTQAGLLVFSDDDATPDADWLVQLSACADTQPDYAMFGGAIVPDWAEPPPAWVLRIVPLGLTYALTAPDLPQGPVFPGLLWGPNMALRRSIFEAGFRFDDSVGPNGGAYAMGSETLMTRRLFAAGYRSWFCPAARVAHRIRARQLGSVYLLQRAYRFGRGKFHQDQAGQATAGVPSIGHAPRWMLHRLALEWRDALRARLARDTEGYFLHRWEINQLCGYLYEAWIGFRRRPLRVLITSYSGELGGMEWRMAQEARLLNAAGYRSALAMRRFPGYDNWAANLRSDSVEVSTFDPPHLFEQWRWRRLNRLRARWLSARRLRAYRAELVHVAFCWTTYGASALWLAAQCRLPTVISVHNAFPLAEISAWHRPLLAEAFRSVRGIYAVSASALEHFMALFQQYILPATRLAVIPNSVDTRRFVPDLTTHSRLAARRALGLPDNALVLGSVARLAPQKRPLALLSLFCRLRPGFPDLHLVLVGSGPLEAQVRAEAARAGVADAVIFTGHHDAVEQILPAFDLHLLLSRNEGFGIATIEAMACGVPAVGTDVPGTADILRDSGGGLLVPLDDEAVAAQAVANLLADPARRQAMGRQGRAEVEAQYSHARLQRQVLKFYHGLL